MAADEEEAERLVANLVGEPRFGRRRITPGLVGQTGQCLGVGLLAPQCIDREVAGGAVEPAGGVLGHAAAGPGLQSLHEGGLDDVLREIEPAHAERPGQHGDKPAELVAKKVLHQLAGFAHA